MNDRTVGGEQPRTHTVRPRWTWLGLAVLLAGLVVVAVGDLGHSWTLIVMGAVLLAVGAGLALYGGLIYDVRGGSFSDQVRDVTSGGSHDFPDPTTVLPEDEVKKDVHRRWLGRQ